MALKDYADTLRRKRLYEQWAEQYKQGDGWTVIPADAKPPVEFTNEDRSYLEIIDFVVKMPEAYVCYADLEKRAITTFMGDKLGTIIKVGPELADNFGGIRQYIKIRTITDVHYWGYAYPSAGDYVRIWKYKDQFLFDKHFV